MRLFFSLWVAIAALVVVPVSAKDFIVKLHTPSAAETKTLNEILDQIDRDYVKCKSEVDPDPFMCMTNVKWYVAQVHLDRDKEPEFVISGNGLGWGGAGNSPLDIYKHVDGKWNQIFGEFKSDDSIEIYDHKTNGFHDIRQTDRRFVNRFDGEMYQCAQCRKPDDDDKPADYDFIKKAR